MDFETNLIQEAIPYLQWPGMAGLFAWVLTLALISALLWGTRRFQKKWTPTDGGLFTVLFFAAIGTALLFGYRIQLNEPLTIPGQLGRTSEIAWPVFGAIPWVLAAGFLGPVAGTVIALLSGLVQALFFTHNPFTLIDYAAVGLAMGTLANQHYRTPTFRLFRLPPMAGAGASLIYPLMYVTGTLLWTGGPLIDELDYAFRLVPVVSGAFFVSMVVAVSLAWVVARLFPRRWGLQAPLEPSPAERSIETRSITLMGLFIALLVVVLSSFGWLAAYDSAYRLVGERMGGAAGLAAENVPNALEIGQNLIQAAADDPGLRSDNPEQAADALETVLAGTQYFGQLLLVGAEGAVIAEASRLAVDQVDLAASEVAGVRLALEGVPFQYYAAVLTEDETSAVVSFIAPVSGSQRALVGRSVLSDNPFTAPLITSLNGLVDIDGRGILVDETGLILYHPVSEMVGTVYAGQSEIVPGLFQGTSPEGRRVLVYTAAAAGRSWLVLVEVPTQEVQQLALETAAPPIGLLLTLALASLVVLRFTLRFVTGSLRSLSTDALRIAQDRDSLGAPLLSVGVDEVGIMRSAFESMRASLKSRLDEQEQLLQASTGVASSLEFPSAVQPLLNAALSIGAASARVVLTAGVLPEFGAGETQAMGSGRAGSDFAYLDSQILHLCREISPLIVQTPAMDDRLRFIESRSVPGAVLGVALRQESHYFGVLWVAYRDYHAFEEDEIRFVSTLAGQGALAAANTRLFRSAEVGRERLAAILASTPDPVIVTDQNHALLLSNPAAWQALGGDLEQGIGKAIDTLLEDTELVKFLKSEQPDPQHVEFTLGDQRVYVAKATPVVSKGKTVGRICVLRDVTRFKELDSLKSDFVSTISHDLRSPLLLIRGYATMVSMVGDLTDEQTQYVGKITLGVDRMATLVDNLLHLGRLEAGLSLHRESVSPLEIAKAAVDNLRPLAERKNIQLVCEPDTEQIPEIQADAAFLERAILNLVENAIKYTLEGGQVRVRIALEPVGAVRFEVADNGIGISLTDQERLFERFYRAPNREARKQSGAGLGLAIVRSIAERHQGRVWVESEAGRGSAFFLTLPINAESPDR